MIHFFTVHFESDMWIDIQLSNIARNTRREHRVWGCLNDIEGPPDERFHKVLDLEGTHGDKLNELARIASAEAAPDDLYVFIDGDAFPVAPWDDEVSELLETYPLVAVRRDENLGDRQPHPCFAVTTRAFWEEIEGDWTRGGRPWVNTAGKNRRDVGGRLLEVLEDRGISWYPLLRTNVNDVHPVLFGVYADLVYHHGGAFRRSTTTSADRPRVLRTGRLRKYGRLFRRLHVARLKRVHKKREPISNYIYEQIRSDPEFVQRYFLKPGQA